MNIEKTFLNKLPYHNLKKVSDLVTFDRPILSIFINHKNEYFLLYLFDSNIEYDEYLFWKVGLSDLYSFFHKDISLKELILVDSKEFLFIIHSDYETIENFDDLDSFQRVFQILLDEVDESWLPKENSHWAYPIPKELSKQLEELSDGDYVNILREQAIYFKVEPRNLRYKTTISTWDASNFLRLITASFLQFIVYDFQKKFSNIFNDQQGFLNSLDQLKSILTPRISDVKYGSFEVALSVDDFNPIPQGNQQFFDWQRTAIEEYKKEVIDFNFNSIADVNKVIEKYPLDTRRKIFNPLFRLADNPNYTVKISDKKKSYSEPIAVVSRETRRTISQRNDQELDEDESDNLELLTFVIAVPEGSGLKEIDKRRLRANTLSFKKVDYEEIPYHEDFSVKSRRFTFINPLNIKIATIGNYFNLTCSPLELDINSFSLEELYKSFKDDIYNYFLTKVLNNPNSPEAKIFFIYLKVD